jgi:hypothetical protein
MLEVRTLGQFENLLVEQKKRGKLPIQGMYCNNEPSHYVNGVFYPYGLGCKHFDNCHRCPFNDCIRKT